MVQNFVDFTRKIWLIWTRVCPFKLLFFSAGIIIFKLIDWRLSHDLQIFFPPLFVIVSTFSCVTFIKYKISRNYLVYTGSKCKQTEHIKIQNNLRLNNFFAFFIKVRSELLFGVLLILKARSWYPMWTLLLKMRTMLNHKIHSTKVLTFCFFLGFIFLGWDTPRTHVIRNQRICFR